MALKLVLFGMVNAASISKPERFVTAVDVFDVLAQQCHQGKNEIFFYPAHILSHKS